jgi:hypothetical protein
VVGTTRTILILATLALVAIGCASKTPAPAGDGSSPTSTRFPTPAASSSEVLVSPLVGTWRRVTTCREFVQIQRQAGFEEVVLDGVAGNGFIPGITTGDQIADPAHPCQGAVPREHSHFFTEDGEFGSLDWNGEQVDDDTYVIIDDRAFVIGNTTFHYQVRGDTIMFEPVIPDDCSTKQCRDAASWSVAVAYPGEEWARVG